MRAAVIRAFSKPLEITSVPEPKAGSDEVLVRVRAAGICGTDSKIAAGVLPGTPTPMIPGHEVAGEIAAGDRQLREGQRVACFMFHPCGQCRWCLAGRESLCPDPPRIGFNRDGGLAEFIRMPSSCVLPFADSVPFEEAAVCMDAVLSPWHAMAQRAHVLSGEAVVVVGAGGLGLNGIQIARSMGARVAAIDPLESHLDEARRLGAELAVTPERVGQVRQWSGEGADVVFEASGTRGGLDTAGAVVVPGGRVVCCGWRPDVESGLPSRQLVLKEVDLIGSRAGTRGDARAALRAIEAGTVKPISMELIALDDINAALTRLRSADVVGRFVVQM